MGKIPCLESPVPAALAQRAEIELDDRHPAWARVRRAVREYGAPLATFDVRRRTGTGRSPRKTLVTRGALHRIWIAEEAEEWQRAAGMAAQDVELNADQARAVEAIVAGLDAAPSAPSLLHRVTGTRK